MAELLRIASAGVIRREIGSWVETDTARDITRSLELIHSSDKPAMTMIAGVSGVGKTEAIKRFCAQLGCDAIYIQAARGEGTAWNFAKSLANKWGYSAPTFNTLAEARMILAKSYIGEGRLLVIDEAQYLNQKNGKTRQIGEAYEWIRAVADEGHFNIAFCGHLDLINAVNEMPSLKGRIERPVIIKEVSRNDVSSIVEGTPFMNKKAIDVLHIIANMGCGLRNVEKAMRFAQLFAGDEEPTLAHLKAAISDLKLTVRGGA